MNKKGKSTSWLLIATVFMLFMSVIVAMVSCNYEVAEDGQTTVSFVPSAKKSLNQTGTAQSTTDENVDLYHWQYAVAQNGTVNLEDPNVEWKNFSGQTTFTDTGLGTIQGLTKNANYGFALRGYSTSTDENGQYELMWEGKTNECYLLKSKILRISIIL